MKLTLGEDRLHLEDECACHNIPIKVYRARLQNGMQHTEALLTPMRPRSVRDGLGNTYPSVSALCSAYGISESDYRYLRNSNISPCDIVLKRVTVDWSNRAPVCDASGRWFRTVRDLCHANGISESTYRSRFRSYCSGELRFEDIFAKRNQCTAPDGTIYSTQKEMCAAYGISPRTYRARIRRGLSQRVALGLSDSSQGQEPEGGAIAK